MFGGAWSWQKQTFGSGHMILKLYIYRSEISNDRVRRVHLADGRHLRGCFSPNLLFLYREYLSQLSVQSTRKKGYKSFMGRQKGYKMNNQGGGMISALLLAMQVIIKTII